jgi:hypothetical protein
MYLPVVLSLYELLVASERAVKLALVVVTAVASLPRNPMSVMRF